MLSLALRLPFVNDPAYADEGGYLLAAHRWATGTSGGMSTSVAGRLGGGLYGDLWVDRPPLLMLFWRAADAAGGLVTARLFGCLLVATLVVFAGWAGRLVGGRAGAVSAAFTAAALASTPALGAREIDGELLAVPWLMASVTFTLLAVRAQRPTTPATRWVTPRWAGLAGVTGSIAVLTKQNFVDAIAFALVLIIGSGLTGRLPWRSVRHLLGWGLAGAAAVVVPTMVWASTTAAGIRGLAYVLYGFRSDAAVVVFTHNFTAPASRLGTLGAAALACGLVFVLVAWAASVRPVRSWRTGDALPVAAMVMLVVGVAGVALGASYWAHYLIGLVPVTALAEGMLVARGQRSPSVPGGLWKVGTSALAAYVVAAAVVAGGVTLVTTLPSQLTEAALVDMLSASSGPGDTVFIAYGHANVVEESGLSPAYPQLWSLPMRTLDPQLRELTRTLSGSSAPTWVVQWDDFDSWGIDAHGRLAATVQQHYRLAETVCGVDVYLRRDVQRTVTASTSPCPG